MDHKKLFEGADWDALLRKYKDVGYCTLDLDIGKSAISEPTRTSEANLASKVKMGASFDGFDALRTFRGKDIEQIMALLIMRGSINLDNLNGQIVDFGTGSGSGAYILKQYGDNVIGIDTSESKIQRARELGIFTPETGITGDGFEYLASLSPESVDFVSAFMMDRSFSHGKLYDASQKVLKKDGQLLITGGLVELKDELQSTVGKHGKVEDVITVHLDGKSYSNVAFTYTKR
ncbi:class I SAM-dependent methyltransferase [Candidatus Pacearchaeota archaeon]|nr:class I SAM-dependent methyltransferase [Candidatus Pacearchaeota archaeon]